MQLEEAIRGIKSCAERMNSLYGRVVFDEWAVVGIADGKARLVNYFGPRLEGFQKNFAADAAELRKGAKGEEYTVGDFEFARHAAGTSFESFNPDRARRVLGEMRVTSRHTAATTNGPARAPRPASSAPATRWTPRARSKRKSARDGGAPRLATAASLEYAPSSRPCRAGSTAWRDGRHPRRPAQFSRSWASGRGTYARHRRRSSACGR